MKKRIDGGAKDTKDFVYIKTLYSSSAIKLLFKTVPYYMRYFVRDIVKGIDALVSKGNFDENTYIASLLKAWYEKRGYESRMQDRNNKRNASLNYVETDFQRIHLSYQLKQNDSKVVLTIPSIRLGEQLDTSPQIILCWNSVEIYREDLRWFGDPYCITSVKTEIDLDTLRYTNKERVDIEAIIRYGENDIYKSGNKLFRDALVFDEHGIEMRNPPVGGDIFYLYATMTSVVDERIEDSPQCVALSSKAQLYRVMMGADTQLIVNGVSLFPTVIKSGDLQIEIKIPKMEAAIYVYEGLEYEIFIEPP
jgi:hypothetical protein